MALKEQLLELETDVRSKEITVRTIALFMMAVPLMWATRANAQDGLTRSDSAFVAAVEHVLQLAERVVSLGVEEVRTPLRELSSALDPRFAAELRGAGPARSWTGDIGSRTLQVVGSRFPEVRLERKEQVFRCVGLNPRQCSLGDADAFIAFTRPELTGDSARMFVEVLRKTNLPRIPVQTVIRELILEQDRNGTWRVASDKQIAWT